MDARPSPAPPVLKVPVHPAILLGLFLLLGWGLHKLKPQPLGLEAPWHQILEGSLLLGAFALAGWAFWGFKRHGTSPEFGEPVRVLLCTGPYRFTRNPLFITLVLVYAGAAVMLDNVWAVCLLPGLVLALDRLVIVREERCLAEHFGAAYTDYCRRVRRWL